MKKTLGILGGIGPESSAKFYLDIIEELQKTNKIKSNEDYPHIILNSIPAPELVDHEDLKEYIKGLKILENAGAKYLVIICNTAYLYFDELQGSIKIPVIDLRVLVRKYLENSGLDKEDILILGSKKIMDSKIFNINGILINELDKEKINQIIINYNIGKNKDFHKDNLLNIIKKYNPKLTIVACTELSSILSDVNIPKLDTMDLLLNETINTISQ